jgi:hypothetical protein
MNAKMYASNRLQEHRRQLLTAGAALLLVLPLGAQAGGVVTTCTEAALRAAMAGGGTVTFACSGTITLGNTIEIPADTTLDGRGHQITISGSNTVRVFDVNTNATFTVVNLTIANGRSEMGAAIHNAGTVHATNSIFSGNVVTNVEIVSYPLVSSGGAIYNAGTFVASRCAFLQNQATGRTFPAPAPDAGEGRGGAICNVGVLSVDASVFVNNNAIGLWGSNGSDWLHTRGSPGGSGYGGALFNAGVAALANSTIVSNTCTGGGGGVGGEGPYTMVGAERVYLGAGGNGADGGSGMGGAIWSDGHPVNMTNCTVAFNSASQGSGGWGGAGSPPGLPGVNGTTGGAVQTSANSPLVNSLLASNSPSNCSGTITDLGHNLSSDDSSAFTNSSSLKSTNPLLGPLADNGGPTLTMALLPGSPAIDAGDGAAAPPTDQRGVPRPFSLAADIGAFEFWPTLQARQAGSGGIDVLATGISGQTCWLLASSNYSNWRPIATNQIGSDGTCLFHDDCASGGVCQFYRLLIP